MLPRVLTWRAEYADGARAYLSSEAQKITDLLLEFLLHVLQRCCVWKIIYETKDSYALVQNPKLLSPIIHVVTAWLSPEDATGFDKRQSFQVWKCCFKFQYECCILALFEVLKLLWNSEDSAAISPIRQYVSGYCWKILNKRSEAAPISEGAAAWLRESWNSVSGRFGEVIEQI